ncbi:MAG TPA: type III-B CRISPR module RAMP protein Cmr4 [Planctomycetaceae bacterium]|nr:type III-B CRISPR module RAMP protein Cmr4 [Planctomycetaceae bacterium]HRF00060.1 type III-B CRISPR module RAMP protein Cmr4 [Pirellulaceae bacterium]
MSMTKIYLMQALAPTHVGTGRGVGYIDLPIQREKLTNWPLIPGSAFKGVWSDACRQELPPNDPRLKAAFGKAADSGQDSSAGSLIPTDARLVALPIRSYHGTFAWCASPMVLRLLHRDLTLAGLNDLPTAPHGVKSPMAHVAEGSALAPDGAVYLEDLDFKATPCPTATAWAEAIGSWYFPDEADAGWRKALRDRFVVVADDIFDYLALTGTEVATRVRINDDTKTVEDGALWTEESIPAETLLAGTILCDRVYHRSGDDTRGAVPTVEELIESFATRPRQLQIGGKASVGRGRVRVTFMDVAGGKR